jgi:hypothetical protein
VFKAALLASAAAIIVGHNHPSGDPRPSADDVAVTKRKREGPGNDSPAPLFSCLLYLEQHDAAEAVCTDAPPQHEEAEAFAAATTGAEPATQTVALPRVTKWPRLFAWAFFAPSSQQFMVRQPQALVQTPLFGSQQDLSALQQPAMLQQFPFAQQLPFEQHEGTEAAAVPPLLAETGAYETAATAKAAKRRFLTTFIWFLLTESF